MASALLTSSFVARGAVRPTRLSTSNGSRTVMKAGNWCAYRRDPRLAFRMQGIHAREHQSHPGNGSSLRAVSDHSPLVWEANSHILGRDWAV